MYYGGIMGSPGGIRSGWNLPPGCFDHHIPGNRPEDVAWQNFLDAIEVELDNAGIEEHVCLEDVAKLVDLDVYESHLDAAYEAVQRWIEEREEQEE